MSVCLFVLFLVRHRVAMNRVEGASRRAVRGCISGFARRPRPPRPLFFFWPKTALRRTGRRNRIAKIFAGAECKEGVEGLPSNVTPSPPCFESEVAAVCLVVGDIAGNQRITGL